MDREDTMADRANLVRRIMHMDMDAFFASVEQADQPELKGKPVVVGGALRGVVSAASYEARRFGIHSAMPIFKARRLCPQAVFLPVRMARYREVSKQVMAVLARISPLVEQVSIDEAFVDITGTQALHGRPAELAAAVKEQVRRQSAVTCSVGIAPNKFLAKIASDMNKPDGLAIIEAERVPALMQTLPVRSIPGVGEKTAQELFRLGVTTAADLLRFPLEFWARRLGKSGIRLYERAQGIDPSPVVPGTEAKSVGAENTFPEDTADPDRIRKWLLIQAERVAHELRAKGWRGKTVTLKVKSDDFKLQTRNRSLPAPTNSTQTIFQTAVELLDQLQLPGKLRLTGISVSNLTGMRQVGLFEDQAARRQERLDQALDHIQDRFGSRVIKRGRVFQFDR